MMHEGTGCPDTPKIDLLEAFLRGYVLVGEPVEPAEPAVGADAAALDAAPAQPAPAAS